jgi:hypothetical protein
MICHQMSLQRKNTLMHQVPRLQCQSSVKICMSSTICFTALHHLQTEVDVEESLENTPQGLQLSAKVYCSDPSIKTYIFYFKIEISIFHQKHCLGNNLYLAAPCLSVRCCWC